MSYSELTASGLVRAEGRLLLALMLRDIKTRFGGSEWGIIVAVGWPLSHVLLLLLIYGFAGRTAPYGSSVALWFATGIVPFQAFGYMSRFIMLGIVLNRSLLSFPMVKVVDILFARALVEVLNAGLVTLVLFGIFYAFDIDFIPFDVPQAAFALLSMMFFGLSFGVINAIIAAAVPYWITGYALLTIVLWISSGVLFVPDALPEAARIPLSYLPTIQGVEWMRSAYYEGYGSSILDKGYMISFSVITLALGLFIERSVRGRVLSA